MAAGSAVKLDAGHSDDPALYVDSNEKCLGWILVVAIDQCGLCFI